MTEFTEERLERYSPHILRDDVGVNGQEKLLEAKALIIGAGGLGSPVGLYLTAAGVGTIPAAEALQFITGAGELLTNGLLRFDAKSMTFRTIRLIKHKECPVCGHHPAITELVDAGQTACSLH